MLCVERKFDTQNSEFLELIGINSADEKTAKSTADTLSGIFSFPANEGNKSFFVSPELEIMKNTGRGKMGHIAIKTNSVDRAVYHLERRGVKFDYSTATYDASGAMKFIYLADEINGFAYHLVK